MERVQSDLLDAQTALAELKRQYDTKELFIRSAQSEVEKARTSEKELKELRHANKNLQNEVERLRREPKPASMPGAVATVTVKDTENFIKVRDAFKSVWKTGAMDGLEILQKLMEWEPKKE
jgi:hypothetical protein